MNPAEAKFRKQFGHSSLCNCVRTLRGGLRVTRRTCDCGYSGMTREKAFDRAVAELGELTAKNHVAISRRVLEIEAGEG